jgi:Rrf2 family iron-sulfur cluster assembly transcriptional regulator
MRITTQGDYALRCILNIARNAGKKPVTIRCIVSDEGLPLDYVEQLLMKLRRHRLIKSIRGVKGGYVLSRPSSQISIKDVLEAVEGDAFEVICTRNKHAGKKNCKGSRECVLKDVWLYLKGMIEGYLEKQTLKSLLAKRR